MTTRKLILLEFNELCPELLSRFMAAGNLPNFHRFYEHANVWTTNAGEQPPYLEPWVQWVTVHSGMPFSEHRCARLDDGPRLRAKRLWDWLSEAGYRVGVFGSMNVGYHAPINGWVLPDPWSSKVAPYPDELNAYFHFVQRNVQDYTDSQAALSPRDYAAFAVFMATHGLSPSSAVHIATQLLAERGGENRWKRAVILDDLQFDLFRYFYRKTSPHFTTFFLNSTAHYQHFYWRNMDPGSFAVKPSTAEQARFGNAILFGYQHMDLLLGRFIELADHDTVLTFCTALSQQPCLRYEDTGGKCIYRPHDIRQLMDFTGVAGNYAVAPVMAEQFYIRFTSEAEAIEAERLLARVQVEGEAMFALTRDGTSLFGGCGIFRALAESAVLSSPASGRSVPFYELLYQVDGLKSGMHHPDGALWIWDSRRAACEHPEKVSLTRIAPYVLGLFGIDRPSYMETPLEFARETAPEPFKTKPAAEHAGV